MTHIMAKEKKNDKEEKLDEKYHRELREKVDEHLQQQKDNVEKFGHNLLQSSYASPLRKNIGRPVTVDRMVRVHTVARCMAEGMQVDEIHKKYGQKWGIKVQQIYQYTHEVRELFARELLVDSQTLANDILQKYYYLYREAIKDGDKKEARAILDSITNFTKTVRIDITSKGREIQPPQIIELIEVAKKEEGNDIEDIDFEEDNDGKAED